MLQPTKTFSSFSTNDIDASRKFYGEVLNLEVEEFKEMGILNVHLTNGGDVMIYPKDDHSPATFTVLNFVVEDINTVVDELTEKGVTFEQYTDEYIKTNEKGISESENTAIAWFKDPAGNILSVLQEKK